MLRSLLVATVALSMAVPPVLAATGRITCSSNGYRYTSCSVDTDNRVRMVREISTGNLCREGRSWGYDNNRIWVDKGCRAEFEFGRGSGNRSRNDVAVAAGIIGALALGAAIAGSQNPQPVAPPPPPPQYYAPPQPALLPPPPAGAIPPPNWAVGSFQAWDADHGETVQLLIGPRGSVVLRDEMGVMASEGYFRDGFVHWNNGRRWWLGREGPGVMLGDVDSSKRYFFTRT